MSVGVALSTVEVTAQLFSSPNVTVMIACDLCG